MRRLLAPAWFSPACFGLVALLSLVPTALADGPRVQLAALPYSQHCLHGCPAGDPVANRLITRSIYTLSNNGGTKLADWVAYVVSRDTIAKSKSRVWKADPLLPPEETLEPEDYQDAPRTLGIDRGHQAPLASLSGTPAWAATNLLSNITPQSSALNQGAWVRLETAERDLAKTDGIDRVFVLTGPLYEREMPPLPKADEPHRVPSGYWKLIAVETAAGAEAVAFLFDQDTPRGADRCAAGFRVAIADLEERIGRTLFGALDDAGFAALEATAGIMATRLGCP
jgi:endonuclease G, mitochondrial